MADYSTERIGGSGSGLNISNLRDAHNISVSNFQSCFVNNKAEKFKLRRVNQGINGVAQARLMEYRKEERKMQKLLESFEKEKLMNSRSDHNIRYGSTILLKNNDSSKNVCSNCRHHYVEPLGTSESMAVNIENADENVSKQRTESKRERRTSSKPMFEIMPFYMQHSYQHYHYDPHYDDAPHHSIDQSDDRADGDEECWAQYDAMSKWERNHRKSINMESKYLHKLTSQFKALEESISATNMSSSERRESLQGAPSAHSNTISFHANQAGKVNSEGNAVLNTEGFCKNCIRELNVKVSPSSYIEANSQSLLTESERQQLKHRRGSIPSHASEQQINKDPPEKIQTVTYSNPVEVEKIKQIVRCRLSRGESLVDLSHDKMFDNILDVCDSDRIFPASKTTSELTFVDYQSLRKCKYLRESDMNKQSLKEATLRHLAEN